MPRFAFALRRPSVDVGALRSAARTLLGEQAGAHKAFLLDRGIVRERVWAQTGEGSPPLVVVLWDCDDVEEATRLDAATPHERWLVDVVGTPKELPGRPELLSGTTVRATDAGSAQTILALPLAPDAQDGVRHAVARLEDGDLAGTHRALLARAGIREEWMWLQPAGADLPALLLLHWILDDLATAWEVIAGGEDPAADLLRREVVGTASRPSTDVAGWDVEQVLAMHVRRSDSGDPPAGRLATRLELGLSRGRWEALARACHPHVRMGGVVLSPALALGRVRTALGGAGAPVVDTLVGSGQVLVVLDPPAHDAVAVLATLRQGLVDGLEVLPTWPPSGPTGG